MKVSVDAVLQGLSFLSVAYCLPASYIKALPNHRDCYLYHLFTSFAIVLGPCCVFI